ncbi:hypothetical protein JCM13580A_64800 [Streptomyces drozdowiczii]
MGVVLFVLGVALRRGGGRGRRRLAHVNAGASYMHRQYLQTLTNAIDGFPRQHAFPPGTADDRVQEPAPTRDVDRFLRIMSPGPTEASPLHMEAEA